MQFIHRIQFYYSLSYLLNTYVAVSINSSINFYSLYLILLFIVFMLQYCITID